MEDVVSDLLVVVGDSPNEPKEHIEQKKEAIKEGVLTCLNLLRSTIRETNQIAPVSDLKKKIIIKKKNLNILHNESDEEEKENQSTTPEIEENAVRRKTVRGSNASKRSVSIKTPENESPPKRTKTTEDIDAPLSVISPTVVKKGTTPVRKKLSNDGDEKQTKSLRLTRKVQQTADESKTIESSKSAKKVKKDDETEVRLHLFAMLCTVRWLFRKSRQLFVRKLSHPISLRMMYATIKANHYYIKQ